jgi:hypothetical protein
MTGTLLKGFRQRSASAGPTLEVVRCAEVHVPSRLMESISLTGARSRCVSQESRAQRMALLNRQIHSQATRAL